MPHRVIDNPHQLDQFTTFLGNMKLPITVEWAQGRDRTKEQNALQWMWAVEVAHQTGEASGDDVQDTWRLVHGVPILREDSTEFREIYDACIKPLPFEMKKVALRKLGIKITSAMKVRQMVRYMDAVQRECLQMGLTLTEPDPELAKYQNRYRAKDEVAA
jgi:hypothetical protein